MARGSTQVPLSIPIVVLVCLFLRAGAAATTTTAAKTTERKPVTFDIDYFENLFRTEEADTSMAMLPALVIEELIDYHNEVRRQEGAANMIEMQWDENLAEATRERVRHCYYHSHRIMINQNFGFVTMSNMPDNLTEILKVWYDQKDNFHPRDNFCSLECDDYLTMVRADMIQVGCSVTFCDILKGFGEDVEDAFLLACQYFSPTFNQMFVAPNIMGEPCSKCPEKFPTCNNGLCTGPPSSYPPWDLNLHALVVLEDSSCPMIGKPQMTFLMMIVTMIHSRCLQ